MKRSSRLARRTPLRTRSTLSRTARLSRSPMKRRPRKARPGDDRTYRRWIAGFDCCAPGCSARAPSHPHHHSLTGQRGTARKPPDRFCMPLCFRSHRELHALSGAFKGWTKARLRAWQDARVAEFQSRWAREGRAA